MRDFKKDRGRKVKPQNRDAGGGERERRERTVKRNERRRGKERFGYRDRKRKWERRQTEIKIESE